MKRLVQTRLEGNDLRTLARVSQANATSEASTLRTAIHVGLQVLDRELEGRKHRLSTAAKKNAMASSAA